jgi:hypothetical protein
MNIFCEGAWLKIWDTTVAANLLYRIRLFKNNRVPAFSDTIADYVEADFSGYTGGTALAWGAAFINGASQGEIDASQISWTHTGGATANLIYGIYVTDVTGALMYAERFPAPSSMSSIGDNITYNPIATVIDQ